MNEAIHQELPFLRRFARALVGHQGPGDRLVAEALRRAKPILSEAGAQGGTTSQRVLRHLLFRAMVDVESEGAVEGAGAVTIADEGIVASRVRALPRDAAIVLLLAALERFAVADIAFIMRLSVAEAEARLRAAQTVLEQQASTRVLIIEDEPVIAMDIAGIVRAAGHDVLGIAATRDDAVEMAKAAAPGLILADIALADDSSGVSAVDDILAGRRIPVIFITAYPERLLDDERVEPSLLITKPFSEHLLRVAIAQALAIDHAATIGVDSDR